MFRSLRSRLVLTHLLVGGSVLLLLAISFLAIQVSNPAVERFVYERLDLISRVATAQTRIRPAIFDQIPLERSLVVLGRGIDATGLLLSSEGEILARGPGDPPSLPAEVIAEVVEAPDVQRGKFNLAGSGRWLYLSRPFASGQTLVLLAPRPTLRTILTQIQELLTPMWQAGILALFSSLALAFLLARWVSNPLNSLTTAARGVASGDLEQRVSPGGPTEIRSLARNFNEMVEQVRASQQAQKDFIANVSHELKTPLTSIAGFAQAIVDGTASDPSERRRAAEVIHQESQRLKRMVDQLLSLARFDAGQVQLDRQRVELSKLLQDCLGRMIPHAQQARVDLQLEPVELPSILADGDRLSRVVINLLDNAIKHTPEGGRVRLEASAHDGWVSVSVQDTGVGMEAGQLSRIFERFYQVDSARVGGAEGGAGLGLAISYEIIRAHGGRMEAESTPGHGSRFSFHLPIAPTDASTLSQRSR